ncbi:MAG: hypothetical protein K8U57_03880 [Planctomycetes bacterium]|nr:hypothetical protein [Planctomycetota bacterium]
MTHTALEELDCEFRTWTPEKAQLAITRPKRRKLVPIKHEFETDGIPMIATIWMAPREAAKWQPPKTPKPRPADRPANLIDINEAAMMVGLATGSLRKRITESGGRMIWHRLGRQPGNPPLYKRDKFQEWFESAANVAPPRTKADRKKRKR